MSVMTVYDIIDFGACSSKADNMRHIQTAIDMAFKNGGGRVIIPSGLFFC